MRSAWKDPLSTFFAAVQSTAAWVVTFVGTLLIGLSLGMWIGFGKPPSLERLGSAFRLLLGAIVLQPGILVLFGLTALLWYLPLKIESGWLRVVAAVVH